MLDTLWVAQLWIQQSSDEMGWWTCLWSDVGRVEGEAVLDVSVFRWDGVVGLSLAARSEWDRFLFNNCQVGWDGGLVIGGTLDFLWVGQLGV